MAFAWLRAGAWSMGWAGLVDAVGSATYGDWVEVGWCGAFALGFALFGLGVGRSGSRASSLAAAGLGVAAVPSTHWLLPAITNSAVPRHWALLGLAVDLAALASMGLLLMPVTRAAVAWLMTGAFCVGAVAAIDILFGDGVDLSPWTLANVALVCGSVLLATRPAAAYTAALAPSAVGVPTA